MVGRREWIRSRDVLGAFVHPDGPRVPWPRCIDAVEERSVRGPLTVVGDSSFRVRG